VVVLWIGGGGYGRQQQISAWAVGTNKTMVVSCDDGGSDEKKGKKK
jgi:hypothetical protein